MPLAVNSYADLESVGDGADLLNLAWTLDEREHLSVDLLDVCAGELREEAADETPYLTTYFVKDPFGTVTLGPSVDRFFGAGPISVTCGAGVGPLLSDLVRLAGERPVYVATDTYPDLPHWVDAAGGRCVPAGPMDAASPVALTHAERALRNGVGLVTLERPCLTPDPLADLDELRALCAALEADRIPVLVDESNANYYPAAFSAVHLVAAAPNLVVVRGLSKAWGMGGLRLGYCVSQPQLARRIRTVVPPLLASSLSLRLGRAILDRGDVAEPLRRRIAERVRVVPGLLAAAGVGPYLPASEFLPYVLVGAGAETAVQRLRDLGILAKLHPVWSTGAGSPAPVCRISVPLRDARMDRLRELLAAARTPWEGE